MTKKTDAAKTDAVTNKLMQQVSELTADLQRTRADFENYRKQNELQRDRHAQAVRNNTILKFLPLLDDISLAIKANPETLAPFQKSLEKTLSELKLKTVDASQGVNFDPGVHEAVMVEGDGERELISETLRPGYYYEGELVRPAMVKVKKQ